jgi:hypothetical protein
MFLLPDLYVLCSSSSCVDYLLSLLPSHFRKKKLHLLCIACSRNSGVVTYGIRAILTY